MWLASGLLGYVMLNCGGGNLTGVAGVCWC
jgi:hypothetical protein